MTQIPPRESNRFSCACENAVARPCITIINNAELHAYNTVHIAHQLFYVNECHQKLREVVAGEDIDMVVLNCLCLGFTFSSVQ